MKAKVPPLATFTDVLVPVVDDTCNLDPVSWVTLDKAHVVSTINEVLS